MNVAPAHGSAFRSLPHDVGTTPAPGDCVSMLHAISPRVVHAARSVYATPKIDGTQRCRYEHSPSAAPAQSDGFVELPVEEPDDDDEDDERSPAEPPPSLDDPPDDDEDALEESLEQASNTATSELPTTPIAHRILAIIRLRIGTPGRHSPIRGATSEAVSYVPLGRVSV